MTINQRHFLAFIRYALMGGDYPHGLLTESSWKEQQAIAKRQTVSGIFFNALSKLPPALRPPQQILMKLYSYVVYYENMNKMLNERTCEIFDIYHKLGFHPVLLKGQGAATLYKNPGLRVFGDIDIYVPDGGQKLMDWVKQNADDIKEDPRRSHILAFSWQGATIENHLCLLKFYNKRLFANMQSIVADELNPDADPAFVTINGQQIETLPPTLGLLYLIVHFSRHLISSGVGVRQLCDITLHIHHFHQRIDTESIERWFDKLEMRRMANAVAAACVKYLGLPDSEVPYDYKADEWGNKADELMQIIMDGGNSGYWQMLGKRQNIFHRAKLYLKQQFRIYPYMPHEVATEIWLKLTHRFK